MTAQKPLLSSPEVGELLRALHGREEWFRAVFEGSAVGIAVADTMGRFITANAAFHRMVGFDADELRAMAFREIYHPDDDAGSLPLPGAPTGDRVAHYRIEKRYRRKDGTFLPVRLTTLVVRDGAGRPRFCVALAEDIAERNRAESQRRALEERLRHSALHDPLTGLPNRALLTTKLERAVERAAGRHPGCAVLFLDLDRFKVVNDSLGHLVGDELLRVVAARLRACVGGAGTVARFGGDEFVILLEELDGEAAALELASRVQGALSAPIDLGGYEAFATASVGIAIGAAPGEPATHLLRNADMALFRAKAAGTGRWAVFDRSMHADAMVRLQRETDLRHALQRGELSLAYQPLVDLATGRIAALEALARWEHPVHGTISPAEFIPLAEDTGLILPLGGWALTEALRQHAAWRAAFPDARGLELSVNISPKQLRDPTLVDEIGHLLNEHDVPAGALTLELTESTMMESTVDSATLLRRLRELEVRIYLDDFGTGYSNLGYLHRMALDALKIDRSFVHGLDAPDADGRMNAEIVRTIIALARSLGVRVVAEGIETPAQRSILRNLGCDYGQGFLFSSALAGDAAGAEFLAAPRQW